MINYKYNIGDYFCKNDKSAVKITVTRKLGLSVLSQQPKYEITYTNTSVPPLQMKSHVGESYLDNLKVATRLDGSFVYLFFPLATKVFVEELE